MPTTRRIANPIAVRRFLVVDEPGREVVLTIGKPRLDQSSRSPGTWFCSVLIEGIPDERRRRVHGVDAVQALQLAMEYARRALDASGVAVTLFEHGEPGDTGLPFAAPIGYGFYFQRRLEAYMEREKLEMATTLSSVLQDRARMRAARGPSR
ncbi:MAG: hypothetical protein QM820_00930 [Minicystis sp.]